MEVVAFMEVAAQRRDMLCLGQCERAVVHPVCIHTSGDHAYPTFAYATHAVGYARNLIDKHYIDVLAVETRGVLDQAE